MRNQSLYVEKLTYLKTKIVGAFTFQMQTRVARSTTHNNINILH